jgi:molecular chaperone HscB
MELQQLRTQKQMGEDDPALIEELSRHRLELEEKFEGLFNELKSYWDEWNRAVDSGSEEDRRKILAKMLDLLNRRNYIRNLVRDVNEALES